MKTTIYVLATLLIFLRICEVSIAQEGQTLEIAGQVVDYMARPVEGAEIAVYEKEYRSDGSYAKVIAPRGKTDRDGRFTLQAMVSSQRNTLVVAKKDGLALAWDGLNYGGNTKGKGHFLLVLEKTYTLTGVVVDHTGNVVRGAEVQALPVTSYMSRVRQRQILAPAEWFTTVTNDRGVFRFNRFAADVSADFWIKAPKLNCTYKFTTHYQDSCGFEVWRRDIRLALPREGNIKGHVVEAGTGRPVGGVKLTIQADRDRRDILNCYCARTVVAGADGAFTCAGLAEGKHKIEIANSKTETATWIAEAVKVNLDPDRPMNDIKVLVHKGGIIECVVRDNATEQPLPRMHVSAYRETFNASSITDEKGKVRIRVPEGDYQVYASGQPFTSWRVNNPVAVRKGQSTHVNVRLDKSPVVEGVVTEADGRPARDVLVTIHPFGDHVYTDKRGRFVAGYDERRADKGLFVMARDSKRPLASALHAKQFDKQLRLAMEPALTVKGQVTDPNGTAVKAARISLHIRYISCLSSIGPEVLTDSKGHFEFNAIMPKHKVFDYRISVHAAGFGPKTYDRISIEGQPGTTADIGAVQLAPADSSISGIVVDANGLPAARVPIFLRGSEGADQPRKTTATNKKGQFAFTRICKAPLRFQANFPTDPGGMGNLNANGGDKDVKIILGQKGTHTSFVSLTGKPLPDLSSFNVKLSQTDLTDKRVLVCFFDMDQRPSRNCARELAMRAKELKQDGVVVVAVQASKIDQDTLHEWTVDNSIPFPVGMIIKDPEKTRLAWGIKSLPWLILTDSQHVVSDEGFGLSDLDGKIKEIITER